MKYDLKGLSFLFYCKASVDMPMKKCHHGFLSIVDNFANNPVIFSESVPNPVLAPQKFQVPAATYKWPPCKWNIVLGLMWLPWYRDILYLQNNARIQETLYQVHGSEQWNHSPLVKMVIKMLQRYRSGEHGAQSWHFGRPAEHPYIYSLLAYLYLANAGLDPPPHLPLSPPVHSGCFYT